MNDWERINVVFKDTRRDFPDVTFEQMVEVLVMLLDMGYVDCYMEVESSPVTELHKEEMLEYYGGGLNEREIEIYPKVPAHYFHVTQKGREEEDKDIYDVYYPSEE